MKNQIEDVYSLSPTQEGILYHHLTNPTSGNYILQTVFAVVGDCQATCLEESLAALLTKYPVLRTRFLYKNLKQPQQVVVTNAHPKVHFEDITHLTPQEQQQHIQAFRQTDRHRGFDISKEALLRIAVFVTATESYKILLTCHHIAIDGWSLPLVLNDFFRFYQFAKQQQAIPAEHTPAYSRYINWLSQQDKEEALAYWEAYLSGYEEVAEFPKLAYTTTNVSPEARSIVSHVVQLSKPVTTALQALASTHNTTLGTVFQALWALVLLRYSSQDDVVFGWVTSGRPPELPDVERIVGLFISTAPVRVRRQDSATFADLVEKLREASLQRQAYEYVGLSEIQQQSPLKGQLLNHLVIFQNYPATTADEAAQGQERVSIEKVEEQTNYDFDVVVMPGEELRVMLAYNAHQYPDWLVKNIGGYLVQLAEAVTENAQLSLQDPAVVALLPSENAQWQMLNATNRAYRQDLTLADLFEEQVVRTPNHTAVVYAGKSLSYQQLNQRANQIAQHLQQYALVPDDRVGLLMERSDHLIVAMLGILKAGAAYVPLDPAFPALRQSSILRESGCKVVLTHRSTDEWPCPSVDVIALTETAITEKIANPARSTKPHHLAYVIYSSGTTGKPKGIMIEHRSIVNLLYYYNERYQIPQLNGILQLTNVVIDIALQEVFSALMNGLPLYVPSQELIFNPAALRQYIEEQRIAFIQVIPDTLREYLAGQPRLESLQIVLCGGDKLPDKLKDEVLQQGYTLYNVYGQTETTIDALISRCKPGESGLEEVVANYQIHVLDKQGYPQPVGVSGEICIGGVGVGRGYLNEKVLTNEKFVTNPFAEGRLYKTGDLGRWLANGRLEFIGRSDAQVKVRGYRIELGEVEKGLLSHPNVREAVVVALEETNKEKYLCAYYTSSSATESISGEQLRHYLQSRLPTYMVPSYLVELPQLPINTNGKIDRKALPLLDKSQSGIEYLAPGTEIEKILTQVWADVLKTSQIGINDNFFQLGGDSIKAIQVISRLQQRGFKLSIAHLMQYPRLREAARQVKPLTETLDQGLVQGDVKLTPVQQWYIDFNFTDPHHFVMPWMLYLPEGLEESHARKILEALALQHDALRIVYRQKQGQIKQYNRGREGALYDLQVVPVPGEDDAAFIGQAATRLHASMDLTNGPLLKANLFRATNGDHLLLSIHHLIMDTVSWRILLEDFITAYEQLQQGKDIRFPAKTSSFQQWAEAVHSYARSPQMQEEIAYWQQVEQDWLSQYPPQEGPQGTIGDLAREHFFLSTQETNQLQREVHQAYNTQMNDVLLTALGLALREWSGQPQHMIMLEGHGREEVIKGVDVTRTIGWFTAHFLQPLDMQYSHDLSYQLRYTKEQLRRTPHKGIGYEIWKHLLKPAQPIDRVYPLVNFNYIGEFTEEAAGGPSRPSPYPLGRSASLASELVTDIMIIGQIDAGQLAFTCSYNSKRFEQSQVAQLMSLLKTQLLAIITHCAAQTQRALTPSDYSANDLSLEDLALLQGQFSGL